MQEVFDYLKKHDIPYTLHTHPAVFTVEESKFLKQKIPGLHCKCLFLEDETGKFYLVALPAEKRLDTKKLRAALAVKKINFAQPEKLKAELNLVPGSVSIFGMIYAKETTLIIDKEVWAAEIVGFHPNINTATLELPHTSLEKFYNSLTSKKQIMEL